MEIDYGYCHCGCGEKTNVSRKKPYKFVYGHQARGSNNSRHGIKMTDELKQRISRSRLGQFSGELNPFYGKEHSDKTKKLISNATKGKQIGEDNPFFGKTHTPESLDLIRRSTALQRSKSTRGVVTIPEKALHNALNKHHIEFLTEYTIGHYCVDVFIPSMNLVIFMDGCYWHSCLTHFPNKSKRATDAPRVSYLNKSGHDVVIVWEHDVPYIDSIINELLDL